MTRPHIDTNAVEPGFINTLSSDGQKSGSVFREQMEQSGQYTPIQEVKISGASGTRTEIRDSRVEGIEPGKRGPSYSMNDINQAFSDGKAEALSQSLNRQGIRETLPVGTRLEEGTKAFEYKNFGAMDEDTGDKGYAQIRREVVTVYRNLCQEKDVETKPESPINSTLFHTAKRLVENGMYVAYEKAESKDGKVRVLPKGEFVDNAINAGIADYRAAKENGNYIFYDKERQRQVEQENSARRNAVSKQRPAPEAPTQTPPAQVNPEPVTATQTPPAPQPQTLQPENNPGVLNLADGTALSEESSTDLQPQTTTPQGQPVPAGTGPVPAQTGAPAPQPQPQPQTPAQPPAPAPQPTVAQIAQSFNENQVARSQVLSEFWEKFMSAGAGELQQNDFQKGQYRFTPDQIRQFAISNIPQQDSLTNEFLLLLTSSIKEGQTEFTTEQKALIPVVFNNFRKHAETKYPANTNEDMAQLVAADRVMGFLTAISGIPNQGDRAFQNAAKSRLQQIPQQILGQLPKPQQQSQEAPLQEFSPLPQPPLPTGEKPPQQPAPETTDQNKPKTAGQEKDNQDLIKMALGSAAVVSLAVSGLGFLALLCAVIFVAYEKMNNKDKSAQAKIEEGIRKGLEEAGVEPRKTESIMEGVQSLVDLQKSKPAPTQPAPANPVPSQPVPALDPANPQPEATGPQPVPPEANHNPALSALSVLNAAQESLQGAAETITGTGKNSDSPQAQTQTGPAPTQPVSQSALPEVPGLLPEPQKPAPAQPEKGTWVQRMGKAEQGKEVGKEEAKGAER